MCTCTASRAGARLHTLGRIHAVHVHVHGPVPLLPPTKSCGHFASKSRRYSTTLGAIRGERQEYRRRESSERARLLGHADPYDDTVPVIGRWEFTGIGYLTGGDAALALSAAARARERREAARDATD